MTSGRQAATTRGRRGAASTVTQGCDRRTRSVRISATTDSVMPNERAAGRCDERHGRAALEAPRDGESAICGRSDAERASGRYGKIVLRSDSPVEWVLCDGEGEIARAPVGG